MAAPELSPQPAFAGPPSDAALVVAARASEAWACEALYRRHVGTAHGLACRLFGRDRDLDDLLQDSFIAALGSLDKLADPNAFRSWLCSIVVRKTCKLIRKRRLLASLGLAGREAPVDVDQLLSRGTPPDVATELRAVYRVLDSLPADVRTILVLRRVEGCALEEIAELVGLSLATVKRRLTKGEEMLTAAFADKTEKGAAHV
jgi:RNA polymerase sigma-70 factor (ECF subfamily)